MTRPPPNSALTRAAEAVARRRLSPGSLNQAYRTFAFAAALGELTRLDVDLELLFAAALLRDVGLATAVDVAEEVGLSTAATDILLAAVTLDHSPGLTLAQGEVAYLLSAAGTRSFGRGDQRPSRPRSTSTTAPLDPPPGSEPVMTTTTSTPTGRLSRDAAAGARPAGRRVPFAVVVAAAMVSGLVNTLLLVLVVFAGATEPVITGAGLVGLASGWALLAMFTTRWTSQPQRWAAVPAAVMATTGAALLAVTPGNGTLTAAGWVWPAAALGLAVWMVRATRRATTGRTRWLVYPAIGLVAVVAIGGTVESIALTREHGRYPMTGARYDVGGHRLHLTCTGTGSPTVVLENGLNEISPLWSGVVAQVSGTTRVCAYDRAGQGWSDDVAHPQDGVAVAADLHTLLSRAGEQGPFVLAGHSSGGTLAMTYAARYPAQVAGMVLLDSSSPHQYTDQPDFAGTYAMMRRVLPVMPAFARVGALHLIPASTSTALTPSAAAQVQAFATSPRGANNLRDEQAQLRNVFTQAQALTTFDPKPLAVVTASENANGTKGWSAAQDRMAALSTNSTHLVADTTHVGLLDDADGSIHSVRAITAVVTAVRTGTPLASR